VRAVGCDQLDAASHKRAVGSGTGTTTATRGPNELVASAAVLVRQAGGLAREDCPMDETLIAACQMFLVPASILFATIGLASTEPLKFLLSAVGAVLSGVWWYRIQQWDLTPPDKNTALWLAGTFGVAAFISTVVHLRTWIGSSLDEWIGKPLWRRTGEPLWTWWIGAPPPGGGA
jgi:hypothetical protein